MGQGFVELFKRSIHSASALGVICANSDNDQDFFKIGMLLERVWLDATGHQFAFQPVSPVTLLYFAQKKGAHKYMNKKTTDEIRKQYELLVSLLDLPKGFQPSFVFRLAETFKKAPISIRKKIPLSYSK